MHSQSLEFVAPVRLKAVDAADLLAVITEERCCRVLAASNVGRRLVVRFGFAARRVPDQGQLVAYPGAHRWRHFRTDRLLFLLFFDLL